MSNVSYRSLELRIKNLASLMVENPSSEFIDSLMGFKDNIRFPDFGTSYLRQFLKNSYRIVEEKSLLSRLFGRILGLKEITEDEIRNYGLRLDTGDNTYGSYSRIFKNRYYDALFNLCLIYKENIVASIGFNAKKGRIHIMQIQGVKGRYSKLKPFKWERALVRYTVQWAEKYGIPEVSIASVDGNKWGIDDHLKYEQGKILYDVTARRCGFKRTKSGYYLRRLAQVA